MKGSLLNAMGGSWGMTYTMQPFFTCKTYLMSGLGWPPRKVLYKGLKPNLLGIVPAQTTGFIVKHILDGLGPKEPKEIQKFQSSVMAGASVAPVATVFEGVMIREQVARCTTKQAIQSIYSDLGMRGFFRGFKPTLVRDISFNTSLFFLYPYMKEKAHGLIPKHPKKATCAALTVTSILAGSCSNPPDVVKTLMQKNKDEEYRTVQSTIKILMKEKGKGAFFRGGMTRIGLVAGAIYFLDTYTKFLPRYLPASCFKTSA